jgi:hypothetical protein
MLELLLQAEAQRYSSDYINRPHLPAEITRAKTQARLIAPHPRCDAPPTALAELEANLSLGGVEELR